MTVKEQAKILQDLITEYMPYAACEEALGALHYIEKAFREERARAIDAEDRLIMLVRQVDGHA